MDRAPALPVKQIEANDAVRVYVWVPGYRVFGVADKDYLGGLCGVSVSERGLDGRMERGRWRGKRTSMG